MKKNTHPQKHQYFQQIDKKQPINLVLSGGGVKGVAHIALLEFLEENNISIQAISGSSAGALVGALYCSGLSPREILQFFKTTPIFRYTWLNPAKAGIFDSNKYESVIKKFVKQRFEDLDIPLTITATNIEKGEPVYFQEGNLIPPLLASCATPAVFSPVMIAGELYSDGGVMDNFPIDPFLDSELSLLGSYVCKPNHRKQKDLNSILKVTNHTYSLLLYAANQFKFMATDMTVVFPLGKYGVFETKNIPQIYSEAKAHIKRVIRIDFLPQNNANQALKHSVQVLASS